MLCRQWQVGEFEGDDGGSPISAVMSVSNRSLTTFRPGPDPAATVWLDDALPIEVHVEREPSVLKLRGAVELGLLLEEAIEAAVGGAQATAIVAALRSVFTVLPAEPDPVFAGSEGVALRLVAAGRVLDGEALYKAYAGGGISALPAAANVPAMVPVLAEFAALRAGLFSEPGHDRSWEPTEFRYGFALGSPIQDDRLLLEAADFEGGHLDWYHFTLAQGELPSPADAANQAVLDVTTYNFLPNHVTFRGMPDPRWWDFETGVTDFGQLDAEHVDLPKLLVMEFALVYGNDWFVVPVPSAIGGMSTVTDLVVTDTFGERTLVRPSEATQVAPSESPWSMFKLSGRGQRSAFILLASTLGVVDDSPSLETVHMLRDDLAAMAWAVEHALHGTNDRAVDAYDAYLGRIAADPPPLPTPQQGDPPIYYQLETRVPDNWIPLVPVRTPAGALYFRRGTIDIPTSHGIEKLVARASLLEPGVPFFLTDRIVSRAGTSASINHRRTRSSNGATYLWRAKRSGPGTGEGWSGLRYDFIDQFKRS
jgi:hypothetical protein